MNKTGRRYQHYGRSVATRQRKDGKPRTYIRLCHRCERLYRTAAKQSTVCERCCKPRGKSVGNPKAFRQALVSLMTGQTGGVSMGNCFVPKCIVCQEPIWNKKSNAKYCNRHSDAVKGKREQDLVTVDIPTNFGPIRRTIPRRIAGQIL